MRITTAQVFLIGAALIPWAGAMAVVAHLADATTAAAVVTPTLTAWAAIGTALTKPSDQAQAVAERIDEPNVKKVIIPAVSELQGLDPLRTNNQADATLISLAADSSVPKVLPPKP